MNGTLSKEEFEKEYTFWIQSAAKDIAFSLNQLNPELKKEILSKIEQFMREPESVYGNAGLETVRKFVPGNILLLSTDAVVFSQSIFVRMSGVFDYAIALNRRYYLGSWYSIITLNSLYLKEASEVMLRYTLAHELLQKEIYEENIRSGVRKFTPEEKKKISDDALNKAIEKSGITPEEIAKEKQLMLEISSISPLIPKPFAETALYWYVEKNLEELEHLGEPSRTEKEDSIGKKLNYDFKEWLDFSTNIYKMYLADIKREINYGDYSYA
jgi:hypothetical protein